jgi:hypothetical protein
MINKKKDRKVIGRGSFYTTDDYYDDDDDNNK